MTDGPGHGITTIVSDLGGVLTTPLLDAFVAYSEHCGVALEHFWTAMGRLTEARGENPMAALEVGRLTEVEFLDALGGQLAEETGAPVDISDFGPVWFSHLLPNTRLLARMGELRDAGFRMGLLTNNVREWEVHWRERLGIDAIFPTIVDSGFVGMRKPDPAIYRLTEERLGVGPEEILFLDDMEVNVTAARERGWNAIQFVDNDQALGELDAALAVPGRTD